MSNGSNGDSEKYIIVYKDDNTLNTFKDNNKFSKKLFKNFCTNWFFDEQPPNIIPEEFIHNKSNITSLYRYNYRKFFYMNLDVLPLVNRNLNNLYRTEDIFMNMIFIKTIIQNKGLFQTQLFFFNQFIENDKKEFEKLFSKEGREELGTSSFNTLYQLNKFFKFTNRHLDKNTRTVSNVITDADKERIQNLLNIAKNDKMKDLFLTEINQEIIDKKKLTIFDVKRLNNREILYIFIDGNNNKVYYKEPIMLRFFVSLYNDIRINDYIVPYEENQFHGYYTDDYGLIGKIRSSITENFKNNINLIFG